MILLGFGAGAKPKENHFFFFAQKMLRLSGLAARNFFVSISFSGFKIKSSTFSSLQEESSSIFRQQHQCSHKLCRNIPTMLLVDNQ